MGTPCVPFASSHFKLRKLYKRCIDSVVNSLSSFMMFYFDLIGSENFVSGPMEIFCQLFSFLLA